MNLKKSIEKKSYAVKFEYRDNGKKVAWAFLQLIYQDRHKEPYGLLENVYVEQEYRSKGLGSKLVKAVIQEAKKRGCYKLIATSRTYRSQLHKFYEKNGLKRWGFEFRLNFKKSKPLQRD